MVRDTSLQGAQGHWKLKLYLTRWTWILCAIFLAGLTLFIFKKIPAKDPRPNNPSYCLVWSFSQVKVCPSQSSGLFSLQLEAIAEVHFCRTLSSFCVWHRPSRTCCDLTQKIKNTRMYPGLKYLRICSISFGWFGFLLFVFWGFFFFFFSFWFTKNILK